MNKHYDIAIIGAGIVGLTLANRLANSHLKLLIIDSKPIKDSIELPQEPLRVSAINKRSQIVFQQISAWQAMEKLRVSPYRQMQVWDSEGQGQIHFDSAEIATAELGHIIENDVMVYALQQRLSYFDNVTLLAPLTLESINVTSEAVELSADNAKIMTKLVIGADGANSWVRSQLHMPLKIRSYDHQAIVATVTTEQTHQLTAWQRFLPTGPLAFLPLSNEQQCSIVWSCLPNKAESLMGLDDMAFANSLAEAFEHKLGNVTRVGPRASFPLYMRHAQAYTQDRVALIGDAAHTIHPLAGQGVNLGIADANKLADVILAAMASKHDIGKHAILRRYERARKGENSLMIGAMDGFKQLFASEMNSIKIIRNLGLSLSNRITPLKNYLMRAAMGAST